MGLFGFGFKLIIFVFQKSMQILFTDRVLPTIRNMDQILGRTSITVAFSRAKIMVAYAFISFRFCPPLTGLARLRLTPSLWVDLVLSDTADTSER